MSMDADGKVLVTGGEDATIFILKVNVQKNSYVNLKPIGYIKVPGIVTCLTWHHQLVTNSKQQNNPNIFNKFL